MLFESWMPRLNLFPYILQDMGPGQKQQQNLTVWLCIWKNNKTKGEAGLRVAGCGLVGVLFSLLHIVVCPNGNNNNVSPYGQGKFMYICMYVCVPAAQGVVGETCQLECEHSRVSCVTDYPATGTDLKLGYPTTTIHEQSLQIGPSHGWAPQCPRAEPFLCIDASGSAICASRRTRG
jgi:hypothetical protein